MATISHLDKSHLLQLHQVILTSQKGTVLFIEKYLRILNPVISMSLWDLETESRYFEEEKKTKCKKKNQAQINKAFKFHINMHSLIHQFLF